ncbi:MAG: hypothetical protein Q7S01_04870 [bacterium]|nr:hypothetical protein [bacterium]
MWYAHMGYFPRLGIFLFSLLFIAFPFISRAETTSLRAGFAQSSIWMSRSHVVAGESVNIFTVLYNSSENPISGDAVINVDGSPIGTKSFTLASGETQIVSLPWVAKVGTHTLSARMEKVIDAKSNANAAISDQATESVTVSIEAPPPPSPAEQVLNTVTSAIQTGFASGAPAVMSAANTIYEKTESLRTQAKSALEKHLADTSPLSSTSISNQPSETPISSVTGTSTLNEPAETPIVSKALRYLASAGLIVVNSKTLFYISLVLVTLILLQILRAAFRERRRGRRNHEIET